MTGCRARAALAHGLVALALAVPAASLAQVNLVQETRPDRLGPPVQLRPAPGDAAGQAEQQETRPRDAAPPAQAAPDQSAQPAVQPAAEPGPRAAPPAAAEPEIVVRQLEAYDPSSAGTLDAGNGGFEADMWSGTPLAAVEGLLPRMPVATTSATMQALGRRLLLTAARVPDGTPQGPSLLALRAERLAAAGLLRDLTELLQLTPASFNDPALGRIRLKVALLNGDEAAACTLAGREVEADDAAIWLKASAYCAAATEEPARAELYEQLLREGGHEDKAFSALLDALLGRRPLELASLPSPTPLHLAMLRKTGGAVPEDAIEAASPLVLAALANMPGASPDLRVTAAERAEAAGALPTASLRQVYDGLTFAPDERKDALAAVRKAPGARGHALLYQAAREAADPEARAKAVRAAFESGRRLDRYPTQARVYAPLLQEMEPQPELAWFAADAGRALLVSRRFDAAFRWFLMAQSNAAEARPEAAVAVLTLWPLVQVADGEERLPYEPQITRLWWEGQSTIEEEERFERAILFATLMESLGHKVPGDLWTAFNAGPSHHTEMVPSPMLRHGLRRAAEAGRVGGTVLLALLNLGTQGPQEAGPSTLADVVQALQRIDLGEDARQIALEALVARGF